ncbi:DUF3068 domain-containing protein [Nocardioides sp.]|uniref:DUF3068 domain-containing protein n=1 Tax=Nocardioides sp. TaxID=35761 RepID=UPI001A2C81BD|nr:DUF3068 domain-containing protein [Nocardioides sp.]MBJ7355934.1 DUF3068 domain-containing protein [Nocardioides sp.]
MRRLLGPILVGIGAFLIVTGVLARFYAYPALAVAPIDQNSVTKLEAKDATILDLSTLKEVTTDMSVVNRTVGDVEASEEAGDGTLVWAGTTSYRDEIGNIRSRSAERYAHDAHTGEAINCCGAFEETTDGEREEVKRSGQISKYPFGTEKKDYKFWDATLGQAVTTKFVKESEIEGLKVYEFKYEVPTTTVGTREVPPSLVGETGTDALEVEIQYSTITQHWVEPTTGVVIDRVSETANTLALDGETLITTSGGTFQYTDEQVKENVDEYKGKASSLQAVQTTVPLVGIVLGLLVLLGGILLSRRNRTQAPPKTDA